MGSDIFDFLFDAAGGILFVLFLSLLAHLALSGRQMTLRAKDAIYADKRVVYMDKGHDSPEGEAVAFPDLCARLFAGHDYDIVVKTAAAVQKYDAAANGLAMMDINDIPRAERYRLSYRRNEEGRILAAVFAEF